MRSARRQAPDKLSETSSADLCARYLDVRTHTETLCAPLSPEDAVVQSMPEASPAKWHLAHTTWFFETFVLKPFASGFRPYHERFAYLFNSYYNSVGPMHARPARGMLTRPALEEIADYRRATDEQVLALLDRSDDEAICSIIELGLHHEQQHQELILTDIKHAFAANPLRPAYHNCRPPSAAGAPSTTWLDIDGGINEVGAEERGFAFDNERPRHQVLLEAFQIAAHPVTNAEILEFIADGGYDEPTLWLSDGWDWRQQNDVRAPLYWRRDDAQGWREFTLAGERTLDPYAPACHLSYYEADAFARWAGARLPSEHEWEIAAAAQRIDGNFAERGWYHPTSRIPDAMPGTRRRFFGDVWEWTRSPYTAYPGYREPEGALGEYNGKFMANQMVLRGGSCATPRTHIRASYRNFFHPDARWQFSGLRLARDT